MHLETSRLLIRSFTTEDFDGFAQLMADPEVMRFSLKGSLSREEAQQYFEKRILAHYREHGFGFWALLLDNRLIGLAGLLMQTIEAKEEVELAYRLHPGFWGKGYAREAISAIANYAFSHLEIEHLISIIDPKNIRSSRLARKMGMRVWKETVFHGFDVQIFKLPKTPRTQEEQLTAMRANMLLHTTWFANFLPEMQILPEPDITLLRTPIEDDTYNCALFANLPENSADERIREILSRYREKRLPLSWWVSDQDTPHDLAARLLKAGLSFKEEDAGMALDLAQFNKSCPPSSLRIERAASQEALKNFTKVLLSIGVNKLAYESIYRKLPPLAYCEKAPLSFFLGTLDGKPVATGILALHARAAGIYYLATVPSERKKGFGTAMMEHLLTTAQSQGYGLSTLQASHEGKGLYAKMGYEQISLFHEYSYARTV